MSTHTLKCKIELLLVIKKELNVKMNVSETLTTNWEIHILYCKLKLMKLVRENKINIDIFEASSPSPTNVDSFSYCIGEQLI